MWANKKCKNSHIYNVISKKIIIKKNTWRYHCFTPVYLKYWWYDLQFLRYRVWQTEIGNYGSFFALTPPSKNQKNQNFEKMKRIAGDIINLRKCTKTTIIWGMVSEIQSETDRVFLLLPFFCSFTPLLTKKLKFGKNVKKIPGDIILLHMCTINEDHMIYGSWDIRHDWQFFCHLGPFFLPFDPSKWCMFPEIAYYPLRSMWSYAHTHVQDTRK